MPSRPLGSLRERNGRWQSRIRHPRTGREVTRTWPADLTPTQARRAHNAWVQDVLNRKIGTKDLTIAAHIERWIDQHPTASPVSKYSYRTSAKIIVAHLDRNLRVSDITPGLVIDLLHELGKTYSPNYVKQARSLLSAALKDAVLRGIIPTNPCSHLPRRQAPKEDSDRIDPKVITTAEMGRIIATEPDPLWRCMWSVHACTGMRPGETLELRWGDIDLDAHALRVSRTVTRTATGRQAVSKHTKTGPSRRVSLPVEAVDELVRWRDQLAQVTDRLVAPDAPVFPGHCASGGINRATMWTRWRAACRRADVPETRTLHGVRHWHASTLVVGGVAVSRVAERLGHSVKEVMLRYGKHVPETQVDPALAALPELGS